MTDAWNKGLKISAGQCFLTWSRRECGYCPNPSPVMIWLSQCPALGSQNRNKLCDAFDRWVGWLSVVIELLTPVWLPCCDYYKYKIQTERHGLSTTPVLPVVHSYWSEIHIEWPTFLRHYRFEKDVTAVQTAIVVREVKQLINNYRNVNIVKIQTFFLFIHTFERVEFLCWIL